MKNMYRVLMLVVLTAFISSSLFAKVPKRMLMEDHTGAWCGWCVLGNQAMEDMLVKYGDKFIPVALHNGDKMVSGTHQKTLATKFGVTGYPSGTLNRSLVTGSAVPFHPSYWESVCAQREADESIADVNVTYSINGTTLTAEVTCTLTEDYTGTLAFNLFVMADDLTGTGTGWDQVNYLTGRAGYENHPYYNMSNPVTSFEHQNVMIDMLGGTLGETGAFPESPVVAGKKYTKTFTKDLSTYSLIQNINKVWVIGLVQETGSKSTILNAKMAGKTMPKPKVTLAATESGVYMLNQLGKTNTKTMSFKNSSNYDAVVDFSINTAKTTTPSDWTNSLDVTNATIKAGETKTITLTTVLGSTAAYGNVAVTAKVKDGTEYDGGTTSAEIGLLSDKLENVVFDFGDKNITPLKNAIKTLPYANKTAYIPLEDGAIQAYSNYDFKVIVVPESFNTYGSILDYDAFFNYLNAKIKAGKGVLMTSVLDLFFVAGNSTSYSPNSTTSTFFNTTLGITGIAQTSPLLCGNTSQGTIFARSILGNTADFTATNNFNINEYNSSTHPYYTFYAQQINILDSKIASPILRYNDATLTDATNIAGVKIQTSTNRNVFMGFGFDVIMDATKRTALFSNVYNWLIGTSDVEEFDNFNKANVSVYPNPVKSSSTISFELAKEVTSSDIYVVDELGNRVMDLTNSAFNAGSNNITLDAANLASGKYFVVTYINNRLSQTPFVVTK